MCVGVGVGVCVCGWVGGCVGGWVCGHMCMGGCICLCVCLCPPPLHSVIFCMLAVGTTVSMDGTFPLTPSRSVKCLAY